jgi:hypothetical protein
MTSSIRPSRYHQAPEQGGALGHDLRIRLDAVDHHGADHQRHHRVAGQSEREHRDERGLRARVVGRLRPGDALDRTFAEVRGLARHFLLHHIGGERRQRRAAAGQHAEKRSEASAAQRRRPCQPEFLARRHQPRDALGQQ